MVLKSHCYTVMRYKCMFHTIIDGALSVMGEVVTLRLWMLTGIFFWTNLRKNKRLKFTLFWFLLCQNISKQFSDSKMCIYNSVCKIIDNCHLRLIRQSHSFSSTLLWKYPLSFFVCSLYILILCFLVYMSPIFLLSGVLLIL